MLLSLLSGMHRSFALVSRPRNCGLPVRNCGGNLREGRSGSGGLRKLGVLGVGGLACAAIVLRTMHTTRPSGVPPSADKIKHEVVFGAVEGENRGENPMLNPKISNDPYFWMRDDERKNEKVLSRLRLENAHTAEASAPLAWFQAALYQELKGHVQESDATAPVPRGAWQYYTRTVVGLGYAIHCRKPTHLVGGGGLGGGGDSGQGVAGEEVILDENALSAANPYSSFTSVHSLAPSPSQKLLAYTVDKVGGETYELVVKRLNSPDAADAAADAAAAAAAAADAAARGNGREEGGGAKRGVKGEEGELGEEVDRVWEVDGAVVWGFDDSTLYYLKMDNQHRPFQVWRRTVGKASGGKSGADGGDELLFEERDELFWVGVERTLDGKFVVISTASSETSEVHTIDLEKAAAAAAVNAGTAVSAASAAAAASVGNQEGALAARSSGGGSAVLVSPRRFKVLYSVDHRNGWFFIATNDQGHTNFALRVAPVDCPGHQHWQPLALAAPAAAAAAVETAPAPAPGEDREEEEDTGLPTQPCTPGSGNGGDNGGGGRKPGGLMALAVFGDGRDVSAGAHMLESVTCFKDYLVLEGRANGFTKVWVVDLTEGTQHQNGQTQGEPRLKDHKDRHRPKHDSPQLSLPVARSWHAVSFPGGDVCSVGLAANAEFDPSSSSSSELGGGGGGGGGGRGVRLSHSSLVHPPTTFAYNPTTTSAAATTSKGVASGGGGVLTLVKQKEVPHYNPDDYATARVWAPTDDGTQVPISLVFHRQLLSDQDRSGSTPLLARPSPLHLYGYGSYGVCVDAEFSSSRLPLLNRGVVFAIAHVRGGGEMGRAWYESQGKYLTKRNTFSDFVSCAEHLHNLGVSTPALTSLEGRSAGGLLVGAVLNMRPDLFKTAIAGVPFVDVMTTMSDPSIPLTIAEWGEWGNPNEHKFHHYMRSYSPLENVQRQPYPALLVTAGLNDPRVAYWEPMKWVAKLREHKTDENPLLLKVDLEAGHFSASDRYKYLRELSFGYSFLLDQLGAKDKALLPRTTTSALSFETK